MLSGSGSGYDNESSNRSTYNNDSENTDTTMVNIQHKEPIGIIIIIGLIEVLEFMVLFFILYTSRKTFKRPNANNRSSIFSFIKTLPALKKCFIVSGFVIFLSNTIFFLRLLIPFQYDDHLCSLMLRITGSTCYNLSMVSVYLYMWTRQYLLHSSPVLKAVLPRWLPILSKISFILTVVSFLLPLLMVWLKGNVLAVYVNGSCYHKVSSLTLFPALMMGSTIVTQTSYVILFYATLKVHQKANRRATGRKTSSNQVAARCLKFALLAVLSDCLALVGINLLGSRIPEVHIHVFPKIDLFFNLMCMLFCFSSVTNTMKKFVAMMTCGRVSWNRESIAPHGTRSTIQRSGRYPHSVSQKVEEV